MQPLPITAVDLALRLRTRLPANQIRIFENLSISSSRVNSLPIGPASSSCVAWPVAVGLEYGSANRCDGGYCGVRDQPRVSPQGATT